VKDRCSLVWTGVCLYNDGDGRLNTPRGFMVGLEHFLILT